MQFIRFQDYVKIKNHNCVSYHDNQKHNTDCFQSLKIKKKQIAQQLDRIMSPMPHVIRCMLNACRFIIKAIRPMREKE